MTGNAFISCFFLFLITSLSSIYRYACLFCMKTIATQKKKKKSWREKEKSIRAFLDVTYIRKFSRHLVLKNLCFELQPLVDSWKLKCALLKAIIRTCDVKKMNQILSAHVFLPSVHKKSFCKITLHTFFQVFGNLHNEEKPQFWYSQLTEE